MLSFYTESRVEDCNVDDDGDMLLVQWGTYDWGAGEHFEFNVTRQLIRNPSEDEDIWQLALTFRYRPDTFLRSLGEGNRWCHHPRDIEVFRATTEQNPPFLAVADRDDSTAELTYECAG